jgi:hypothetical protein
MCKTEYLELIRFLGKHFHPSGASYNFALIPDRFTETGWSQEKIHCMVLEAEKLDYVTYFTRGVHGRWEPRPHEVVAVSLTWKGRKLYDSLD